MIVISNISRGTGARSFIHGFTWSLIANWFILDSLWRLPVSECDSHDSVFCARIYVVAVHFDAHYVVAFWDQLGVLPFRRIRLVPYLASAHYLCLFISRYLLLLDQPLLTAGVRLDRHMICVHQAHPCEAFSEFATELHAHVSYSLFWTNCNRLCCPSRLVCCELCLEPRSFDAVLESQLNS